MPHAEIPATRVPRQSPMHRIQTHLAFSPSLRRHIPALILSSIWILFLFMIFLAIPQEGFIFAEIELAGESMPVGFTKFWTGLVIFSMIGLTILGDILAIIKTLFYRIELSPKYLEFRFGILHKQIESIDLHIVTDFFKKRTLIDQLLNLSTVRILSKDIRTPEITFRGLDVHDAESLLKYLQTYASNSLVEYFVSKDYRSGANRAAAGGLARPTGPAPSARVRP